VKRPRFLNPPPFPRLPRFRPIAPLRTERILMTHDTAIQDLIAFTIRKGHKCEVRCERIGRSGDYRCREYRC
jgi:hypothetical protein